MKGREERGKGHEKINCDNREKKEEEEEAGRMSAVLRFPPFHLLNNKSKT